MGSVKLTQDRIKAVGTSSVTGAILRVSESDLRTIEQALADAGSSPGAGGGAFGADFFTLNATDISNGYVTLSETPTNVNRVVVSIVGGTVQMIGTDYTVNGSDQLVWTGMAPSIADGKQLVVMYPTSATGSGSLTAGDDRKVYQITCTPTEVTNEYFDLPEIPDDPDDVTVSIVGGSKQFRGTDFVVIANSPGSEVRRISWAGGLGMTGIVVDTTKIVVEYSVPPTLTLVITTDDVTANTIPLTGTLAALGPGSTMQDALEAIDQFNLSGGAHTHPATEVTTTGFSDILNGQADVQVALSVLDNSDLFVPTGGTDGQVVTRSGTGSVLADPGRRKDNFILSALGARPTSSNGAAPPAQFVEGGNDYDQVVFLDGATSSVYWNWSLPSYFTGTTVTAKVIWSSPSGDTDDVVWSLEAVALTDGESLSTAKGTAVDIVDSNINVGRNNTSAESSAITIAGSPAAGSWTQFKLSRLGSDVADTLADDARLLGVQITYTCTGIK